MQYCTKTIELLNDGTIINILLRCQSYSYGKKSEKNKYYPSCGMF